MKSCTDVDTIKKLIAQHEELKAAHEAMAKYEEGRIKKKEL